MDEQRRKDMERLSTLLDEPHMNVAVIDHTYLRLIAQRLAVIALAGYQREGRGAIILESPRNIMGRANTTEALTYYLPQSTAQLADTDAPVPELWQAVETYNPLIKFVVCMARTPHSSIYILPLPQPDAESLDGIHAQ